MTPLDPPAAAARRQWVLDRMVEDLVGWGCPVESATDRARTLLDHALNAGYALPAALQPAPRRGPGSTDDGRAAARAVFDAAIRARREAAPLPPGQDQQAAGVSQEPPNAHSASEGVGS